MLIDFYNYIWVFFIYAFLGWCAEVIYAALETGKFTNRGFLSGPICPIYGFGAATVLFLLTPLKNNLLLLFLGSVILTSILEFVTGYILEKVFHQKWWDYSDKPFNLRGYISLEFSLLWGLACIFIIYVLNPLLTLPVIHMPLILGTTLITILSIILLTDLSITIMALLKIKTELRLAGIIEESLKNVSEKIGSNLYEGTIKTKEEIEQRQDEIDKIKERYEKIKEQNKFLKERLTKAYPEIKKMKKINSNKLYK